MRTEAEIQNVLAEMERMRGDALRLKERAIELNSQALIRKAEDWHISTTSRVNIIKWVLGGNP